MKPTTLSAMTIRGLQIEVATARRQFPTNRALASTLVEFSEELRALLAQHTAGAKPDARRVDRQTGVVHIISKAYQVAALALRIAEEGDANYRYGSAELQEFFSLKQVPEVEWEGD